MTKLEVGKWVAGFGAAYIPYEKQMVDNGVDSSVMEIIAQEKDDTALGLIQDAGIPNALHRRFILKRIRELVR